MESFKHFLTESTSIKNDAYEIHESEPKSLLLDAHLESRDKIEKIRKAGVPAGYWGERMYQNAQLATHIHSMPEDESLKHLTIKAKGLEHSGWGKRFVAVSQALNHHRTSGNIHDNDAGLIDHFKDTMDEALTKQGRPRSIVQGATVLYGPRRYYIHAKSGDDHLLLHLRTESREETEDNAGADDEQHDIDNYRGKHYSVDHCSMHSATGYHHEEYDGEGSGPMGFHKFIKPA